MIWRWHLPWLAMWLGWIAAPSTLARVLWNDPGWHEIRATRRVIPLAGGGLSPQDDSSDRTLYLRFSVEPLSDGVSDAANRYEAGWVFEERGQPRLGLGNAWNAWGYSAFHVIRHNGSPQAAGEVDVRSAQPEQPGKQSFEYPRLGVRRTVVARIRFIPGNHDQVTVWLDPDLTSDLRDDQLPEALSTRFEADASFDQCVLIHRGGGGGWRIGDLMVATSLDDLLTPPLWKRPLAWGVAMGVLSVVLGTLGWWKATKTRRQLRQRSSELECARVLEQERLRISRDIHDSLGGTLAEISLLSSLAELQATPDQVERLARIQQRSKEAAEALQGIVWATDPKADTIGHFITHATSFGKDLVSSAGLRFEMTTLAADDPRAAVIMSSKLRHHALLAFKEAVHNAVRHASAHSICVDAALEPRRLTIRISDDGVGTCPQPVEPHRRSDDARRGGHGMGNLHARLDAIGGSVHIDSHPDQGTTVQLQVPIDA